MHTANRGIHDSPWDLDRAVVSALLGAVVPVEGSAGQNEGRKSSGHCVEEAVHSACRCVPRV